MVRRSSRVIGRSGGAAASGASWVAILGSPGTSFGHCEPGSMVGPRAIRQQLDRLEN